jgi:preprotein translocase subunit YajC
MDLPLPLITSCIIIILALIIFFLIISNKTVKQSNQKEEKLKNLNEWEKIKEYGDKINKKIKKNK